MSSLEDALEVTDTLIGLLIFAVIIGSVGSIISTMNKEKSEFQETLDGIKFYMNYRYLLPVMLTFLDILPASQNLHMGVYSAVRMSNI